METTAVETALTFGEPLWLWALLLVPTLAVFFWRAQAKRSALIGRIVAPRLRQQLASGVNPTMRWTRAGLVLLAIGLAIVAMAKPRMGYVQREIKTKGRDVLLAVDTSRSMLATDVTPTRLARAKLVSQDLMRLLRGDRLGVIAFAGSAFLQAPLTLDYNAVLTTLDELDTNVIPRGGSNLAAAIQTAIDAFGKAEGVIRALVILTDGEELDADGVAAAKRAGEEGIRIFTIGLGSAEGALIPVLTPDGRQEFVRDASGQPVQSKLDAVRLGEIAEVTGGFYTQLTPDVARELFQRGIEPLEEQETGMMSSRQPIEQYQWPLGAALVCLTLWILLGEGRWSRRKSATRVAVRVGVLLLVGTGVGRADGFASYRAGDYAGAMAEFEDEASRLPESEKLKFNAGAAAYQSGDYAKAVDLFTEALLAEDEGLREDASYNLGNSLTRRGEAAQSAESKKADWTDAIDHYTAALDLDPGNSQAEENRDIVKKMLEDLEKEQEQQKQDQEKKDDEQKEDQNQDDQKQDQEKDDQQKEGEEGDDQEDQQDQQDEKGEDGKPDDQKGEEGDQQDQPDSKDGESGDEKSDEESEPSTEGGESQDQPEPDENPGDQEPGGAEPSPTPGEPKDGDLKSQGDKPGEEDGETGQGGEAEPETPDGEMSEAQARNLLRSMQGDEERVQMMERQNYQDVRKDW